MPAYGAILAVVGIPVVYSLYLSFHQWKLATFQKGVPFVGLDNYLKAIGDDGFWHSLQLTLGFMVVALSIEIVLGIALAVLLDQAFKGRRTVLILLLLPMFVTNVVIGLIWRILLSYDFGVVNWLLSLLGLPKVAWLGDPGLALWSLVIVDVWNTTAFVALLVLAGLAAVPDEPRQAARVDGASSWQTFRLITLPLLRARHLRGRGVAHHRPLPHLRRRLQPDRWRPLQRHRDDQPVRLQPGLRLVQPGLRVGHLLPHHPEPGHRAGHRVPAPGPEPHVRRTP